MTDRPLRNESREELLRELRIRGVLKSVGTSQRISNDRVSILGPDASMDLVSHCTTALSRSLGAWLLEEGVAMQFYRQLGQEDMFDWDLSVRAEVVVEGAAMT